MALSEDLKSPSNTRQWWVPGVLLLCVVTAFIVFLINRSKNDQHPLRPDPAFAAYVSGYTGGAVSKASPILIRLASAPIDSVTVGAKLSGGLLSFSPSLSGNVVWLDKRTIAFTPDKEMKSGAIYTASLKLNKIMKVEDKKFNNFEFGFQIIPQSYEVTDLHLVAHGASGLKEYVLKGQINTADIADNKKVEQQLSVDYDPGKTTIKWQHISPSVHQFEISGIKRTQKEETIGLKWIGTPIGANYKGQTRIRIPAKGKFVPLVASVLSGEKSGVRITFSDPINEQQDLNGLITAENGWGFDLSVKDNEVILYQNSNNSGSNTTNNNDDEDDDDESQYAVDEIAAPNSDEVQKLTLHALQGIQNIDAKALQNDYSFRLSLESSLPGIRFVKQGNLLPSANGMVVPFEAKGLNSVLVRVIKIHQERVGQFLQVNDLDGSYQLNRVGRPIFQQVLMLKNMGNYNPSVWSRFSLELSKLIQPEPGAIYQIALTFTPTDLVQNCGLENRDKDGLTLVDNPREELDDSSFDDDDRYFSDAFGSYYGSDYDWSKRNDPCNSSFYSGSKNTIKQNILATDIGLLAKRGAGKELIVVTTNLITGNPLPRTTLNLYDYQLDKVGSLNTDDDGVAHISSDQKVFLVEAVNNNQWSYLKVNEGGALSISQFDVSGEQVQKGIKGFIYGDRGVWRPGDSVYLSFILEDKSNNLPPNHPVVFELTNPRGIVVDHQVKTSSVEGLYTFRTATSEDAPTGYWSATIKVGGATFNKDVRIETVKPNRLKISLTFPNNQITPESQNGSLNVRWLTGATAANLKASFDLLLSKQTLTIKGFNGYSFDDPLNDYESEETNVFDGNLDQTGKADFNAGIHISTTPPSKLKAYFTGKVFEPGGNFSINYQSFDYFPYSSYIGIKAPKGTGYGDMLELGKSYKVDLASVDGSGNAVTSGPLEIGVYKTQWRWWWEADNSGEASFSNSHYYKKVFETELTGIKGKGSFPLKISGNDWGRYYIRVRDKNTGFVSGSFVYFDWPSGEGSQMAGMPGGATRLSFTTDKTNYKTGETIKLFIPGSGAGGSIFVSVENGSRVLQTYWLKDKSGTNTFSIPVTKDMTPNIYLNVTELQPHGQTVNDLPIRQYGIVGVNVQDPETLLYPIVQTAAEWQPNKKAVVQVKEKNGRPMAYTVAVVDEGLLDLTNFKTPDPHAAFYAKEALGVKTWDVFDQVIGAYGGQLERLFSIGGDGSAQQKAGNHNLRFKPVVRFFGPYFLKKGETATHEFTMPEYVGSVKTMVIATYQGAYGSTEKVTPVRQPLMILSTLPRVAGPGEDILLPVNVFAMKPNVKDVTISVSGDSHFQIQGELSKRVHFNKPGDTLITFKIHVNEILGTGKIKVVANGNGNQAQSETNLTVRNPNPPETRVVFKNLKPGEKWNPEVNFFGIKGTNSAILEVSRMMPLNLEKRLGYLKDYPFGCLEQRVSAAFPQLYLADLTNLTEKDKSTITENVKQVIADISSFQHSSGGFTYWPGSNYTDDWVTSYAGQFLIEAQKKGYQVLPGILNNWVRYQNQRSNSWKPMKDGQDDLIQAYRLYTLALAKKPNLSAMNRMQGLTKIGLQAQWQLAGAYVLSGRKDIGQKLTQRINTNVGEDYRIGITYGSRLRDQAMILQTLTALGQSNRGFTLAQSMTNALNSNEWLSTQETAFCLVALTEFYKQQHTATELKYSLSQNGGAVRSIQSREMVNQQPLITKEGNSGLAITNQSNGNLFVNLFIKGTPVSGQEVATENDLKLIVHYSNMDGKPIDPTHLNQGTDFIAEVTIANPGLRGAYQNLALSQLFPSGWEIRNTRLDGTSGFYNTTIPTYQDIRDDRVYTFFDLPRGQSKTFRILLNATYAGRFYLPGVTCSAMYDHSINAAQPGHWVEVIPEAGTGERIP